jgi:hypothetical protein
MKGEIWLGRQTTKEGKNTRIDQSMEPKIKRKTR